MSRRHVNAGLTAGAIYVLPLALTPRHLADPAPWLGLLAAWVTLSSQPAVSLREMMAVAGPDRRSALFIFAAMIAVQVVAVIEFGFRPSANRQPHELVVGAALVAVGLALRLTAIRALGRWFTSIVRVRDGQQVIRSGVYRFIRHPSYAGALIVAAGVAVALGSRWGLALIPLVAVPTYLYRITVEERALVATLGAEYARYQASTWRLVPLVF